jgi:predicted Zn-ribbon and HTH transcriptional regulator
LDSLSKTSGTFTTTASKHILRQLETLRKQQKPSGLEFYVIGRERAKAGFMWRRAVVTRHGKHFCPKCGKELLDRYHCPLPVFEKNIKGRFKKKYFCMSPESSRISFTPLKGIRCSPRTPEM